MAKSKQESIIDELYESKHQDYEMFVYEKNKSNKKMKAVDKILNSMELCYRGDIPEKAKKVVRKCYDKLDIAWAEELDFWQKEFYRLGVIDGMRMHEEIQENINKLEKKV